MAAALPACGSQCSQPRRGDGNGLARVARGPAHDARQSPPGAGWTSVPCTVVLIQRLGGGNSGSVAVNCIAANASNTPNTCAAAAWLCAGLWRKLAAHRIPTLHALANAERICCSGHLRRGARATEEEEEEGGVLAGKLTWRRQSLQCMYFRRLQKLRPPTRRRMTPS